jgi:trans-aconitate methyltransferase
MPESDPLVRRPAIDLIMSQALRLSRPILDIGVGSGFYGRTLKSLYPNAEIYGLDIWPPYITPRHLDWYKAIILADALSFDYAFFKDRCSLLIAADVVEHFEKQDAMRLVSIWKQFAPWIIITLPIQDFEQGPYMGNVHETHLHQWKPDEVERDLGMRLVKDCGVCGLFSFQE